MTNLIESIKDKSESNDFDFCQIYADPKSYVRPFDSEQMTKPYSINPCPAYIASKYYDDIPSRIKDSEITSITLDPDLFEKFYQLNMIRPDAEDESNSSGLSQLSNSSIYQSPL